MGQSLEQRTQRFLTDMPAVAHIDAGAWCLTQPRLELATRDPQCRVESFDTLGADGETQWYAARYRRSAIAIDVEPEDTLDLDEIVVFADSGNTGRVRPVWRIWTERWAWFLSDVRAEPRAEGLLIELLICLNGTGGCAREYLLANGADHAIVDMPFVEALRARLPEGRTLHKGVTLDLATLRGTWPVAARGDGNCCPSYILDYAVRLEGTRMELVDATLRPIRPATPAERRSCGPGPAQPSPTKCVSSLQRRTPISYGS